MASSSGSDTAPFKFGVRLGIVLIVEAACLSALAVTSLLLYILSSFVKLKRGSHRRWRFSEHIHYYFINLLISDLIQAIGGIIDIKWALDATVTEGTACTVQGIFKQMGDVGVALTSLAIAMHTFSVLVLRMRSGPKVALFMVAAIWIFIALAVGISMATHKGKTYYGNTQYWCWITSDYDGERIGLEYAWMWTAAVVNLFCYIAIALVLKGVITVDGIRIRFPRRTRSADDDSFISQQHSAHNDLKQANVLAMRMLFYPLIYLVTVFPITIVRWLSFAGRSVPFSATAFAGILFSSSGLLNVTLFVLTRPRLLPGRCASLPAAQSPRPLSTTIYSPQSLSRNSELPYYDPLDRSWTTSPKMALTELPRLHIKRGSDTSKLTSVTLGASS